MKFASQNLRNTSQIGKCKPLIRTLLQQVCDIFTYVVNKYVATNLSIPSSGDKSVNIRLVNSSMLFTDLLQRVETTCSLGCPITNCSDLYVSLKLQL